MDSRTHILEIESQSEIFYPSQSGVADFLFKLPCRWRQGSWACCGLFSALSLQQTFACFGLLISCT